MLLVGDGQALASHQAARGQAPVGSWHGLDSIAQPSHIAMAWTIPTTYSVSGMIFPPSLEAPVRRPGMWGVFGAFIVGTGKKVRHLLSLDLVSAPSC